MERNVPPPGLYASAVDVCPKCMGASKSGLIVATDPSTGGTCPVCGGSGVVASLVPLDVAVLSILDAFGLLSEADKKKIAKRVEAMKRRKDRDIAIEDEIEIKTKA